MFVLSMIEFHYVWIAWVLPYRLWCWQCPFHRYLLFQFVFLLILHYLGWWYLEVFFCMTICCYSVLCKWIQLESHARRLLQSSDDPNGVLFGKILRYRPICLCLRLSRVSVILFMSELAPIFSILLENLAVKQKHVLFNCFKFKAMQKEPSFFPPKMLTRQIHPFHVKMVQ